MTKYDAELLSGTIGEAAEELKDTCLAEFDKWAETEPGQAAGLNPNNPEGAATAALYDVRTLLDDYLAQSLAVVLASWGLVGVPEKREQRRMSENETVTIAEFDVATLNEIIPGDWRSIDSFHAEWDHERGVLEVTAEVRRLKEAGS